MAKAVAEMGVQETFRGYGPEQGYDFLHQALVKYYASFGVNLESDEIFISDGAKSDCGNITDIFSNANTILIPDPVYPVYLDTNVMCDFVTSFIWKVNQKITSCRCRTKM